MDEWEFVPATTDPYELATPEELRLAGFFFSGNYKNTLNRKRKNAPMPIRPVCFVDGEGSNSGEPIDMSKSGLRMSVQLQNYSFLSANYGDKFEYIIGADNREQLRTKQCLDFLFQIPDDYLIISFGFRYDVEMILRDLKQKYMERLYDKKWIWWGGYRINWIPHKFLFVERHDKQQQKKTRRVLDILGFWNKSFAAVTSEWQVSTPEEQEYLEKYKALRNDFGPMTPEMIEYNRLEGILSLRLFNKIRREWTQLGLNVPSPHGAGSLAGAMFHKHNVYEFKSPQVSIPPGPVMRAFIGGRFDFARQGKFPVAYEMDINSAYPDQMRSLPCLTCIHMEETKTYTPDDFSLWLVRWSDNNLPWSPFPYRSGKHIRYHSSGIGWYYGKEVQSALRYDPQLEILEGIRFVPNCEHSPFGWIEEYYNRRQELKITEPFAAEVLKIGINAAYGKLAQTKGFTPRSQCLIWAGMITSGTRAKILDAIAIDPHSVVAVSTDSITSLRPLPLDLDEKRLGAWKLKTYPDYLLLGNGFAFSQGKNTHRGFSAWDWEKAESSWNINGYVIETKREFLTGYDSFVQKKPELRCAWRERESKLEFQLPNGRESDGNGWIWPSFNPQPWLMSAELEVNPENLVASQFGPPPVVMEFQ